MGWRFHRVLNIIPGLARLNISPGLARLNISKSGISTSIGPRGADLNIGGHGVTATAGLLGTGLSYRQKLGYHGSGIGVGLFVAALAFAGWRYFGIPDHAPTVEPTPPTTQSVSDDDSGGIPTVIPVPHGTAPTRTTRSAADEANAGADVIAAAKPASGVMFVHRNNSDLRARPATSSPPIKKLTKGEQVTLLALSDKWAEIQDGPVKGWIRASIVKSTPPGGASSRHRKKTGS